MHESAYRYGQRFFELYWQPSFHHVLELGSQNVNGSLRDHSPTSAHYVGLDLAPGKGVDVVANLSLGIPFSDESFDIALASSVFEHDPMFWTTFCNLARLVRAGGLIYLCVPSNNGFHRYPVDCWRFYPDAGTALVNHARSQHIGVQLIESFVTEPQASGWADFVAVFQKSGGNMCPTARLWQHGNNQNITDCSRLELLHPSNDTFDMLRLKALEDRLIASEQQCLQKTQLVGKLTSELENAYRAIALLNKEIEQFTAPPLSGK